MSESKEHHYCPSHPNPLCPMKEGKGKCELCGFDHDKKSLSREDLRVRWEAAGEKGREALARHTEEENKAAKAEAEALKEELARLKAQMKEKEAWEEAEKREKEEREAEERQRKAPDHVFRDLAEGPELVVLPQGEFMMGSEGGLLNWLLSVGATPKHKVRIDYSLAVGKYPMTFDEWDAFVRDSGRKYTSNDNGWGRGRRPVINVNWDDAQEYILWLNRKVGFKENDRYRYRLLSEAEWEYACRAGSEGKWCFGDDKGLLKEYVWYSGNSQGKTHPVGEKKPNAFGLYDMHGNVWEWVEDWYHENYDGAPTDGGAWVSGNAEYRVLRGGSWDNDPRYLRSADRGRDDPDVRDICIGFRIARTLP